MKKSKKWLCAALVLANMVSMNAFAAGNEVVTNGGVAKVSAGEASVTVQGNVGQSMKGKEFTVYQLMTAENSVDGKSIDYTINEKYELSLRTVVAQEQGVALEEVSEYTVIDYMQSMNSNEVAFADENLNLEGRYSDFRYFIEKAMNQITVDGIDGDIVVDVIDTRSDNTVVIDGLDYGYYLVKDTSAEAGTHAAVSMLMLSTAAPEYSVNIKADYPSLVKKIQEDENMEWCDIADFEIGQDVPFKYESNIPNINGYSKYYYAWHDVMDEALTLQADTITIQITDSMNGSSKTYTLKEDEYSLLTNVSNETFVIEIEDIKNIVDREFNQISNGENVYGQSVLVTYKATLNDKAALDTGKPGYENDVRLEFSNNPLVGGEGQTGYTPWDSVVCFTYVLDGVKVNNYGTELEGAAFRLYADEACENEIYVKKEANRYHVMNEDSYEGTPENAVEIVSAADGTFEIYGLDSGTYYLKEESAPAGYRPILDPIKLVISSNFPQNKNTYVKGEAASEAVLNLSATAKTKVYINGSYHENEVDLTVDQARGSMNLSVVNDIGKKLPITGSYMMPVLVATGVTLMAVSFKKNKKEHE